MTWQDDVTLSVGFGFGSGPLASSPTFSDVVDDVRGLTIDRGRSSVSQSFGAGSLTVQLNNRDGTYDPNNSQSTHHPNIKRGVPVRIQATHNAVTYTLFRGHVTRWPVAYPNRGHDSVVTVEAVENAGILRGTRLNTSYSQESTDTRIGNILDDASWPAGARDLDTGIIDVAARTFAGDAGELIAEAVEAEQGSFFIAKNGDATFLNRVALDGLTSQATFDTDSGLGFRDVQLSYDDDLLINLAEITGADGIVATASDSTSISEHGEQSYATSNDSIISEPYALNVAEWIVAKHKDWVVRVVGLKIRPQKDPANLWPEVLGRELRDLVTVNVDPPGAGDSLSQVVSVEKIKHDITPSVWDVSYGCHPLSTLETETIWILGTSELGVGTRLG